jgi:UDP-N-acetylglucosamine 2-epimerase (non-hydrolysing)
MPRKVLCVVGARPNFIKIAPLLTSMRRHPDSFEAVLVHTGQHYDTSMSGAFFAQLGLPDPEIHLGVGPGSHAEQTGAIMIALEAVLAETAPDLVLVVGDVNSTIAAAVVAAKAGIPVAHVEAGLRSFDRRMPEEINRVVTDSLSSYLFVTEEDGMANLRREGVDPERTFLVGNVMIDTLITLLPRIRERRMAAELGLTPGSYGVVTLHRPSNVDDAAMLRRLVTALGKIAGRLPLVFPAHPRTTARLAAAGLTGDLVDAGVRLVEPMPYVEFISLAADARLVLTDSGGIQEETTMLGVPCLTLRDNTERPVTVMRGTNRLVGTDPVGAVRAVDESLAGPLISREPPPFWDGHAADRIVAILDELEWRATGQEPAVAAIVASVGPRAAPTA